MSHIQLFWFPFNASCKQNINLTEVFMWKYFTYLVCYLYIFFFSGATQFTLHIQWKFAGWCLSRRACKTAFRTLLNDTLWANSVSNYRTPSPNTGWFSKQSLLLNGRKSLPKKLKAITNFNHGSRRNYSHNKYSNATRNCSHSYNNLIK